MKTHNAEETDQAAYSFFETTEYGPIANRDAGVQAAGATEEVFLDKFLSAIKWIFLYIPGVAYLHMLVVGFGLSLLYQIEPFSMSAELLGAVLIGTFMVMLGVGKLSDLRYLRVVAGIVAASSLAAIVYLILAAFFPGDLFGRFYQLSLPVIMAIGYLVKRQTDTIQAAAD